MCAISVHVRSTAIIQGLIKKYAHPDSIILTDNIRPYVKAYNNEGYEHKSVDQSKWFKDTNTGVHTNNVEGVNNGLKSSTKPCDRTEEDVVSFLLYFIWRKKNNGNMWEACMEYLKSVKH